MVEKEPPSTAHARVTIFVSDPSAEAEQVASALRGHGYVVLDVPLAMLVARVAVQRPRIVLIDADADGAYAAVLRMRELPDSESIDVLFLGKSTEPAGESIEDAGSFFGRPVDVLQLVRRIETLTSEDVSLQPSVPSRPRVSAVPSGGILPSPSMRIERTSVPPASRARISQPPPSVSAVPRRGASGPLSNELLELLAEAEARAQAQAARDSQLPSPDEEIEAVLPTELLAALDEPLEEPELEEDESDRGRQTTSSGGRKVTTGASSRPDLEAERESTSNERIERTQHPTVPPSKGRESSPALVTRENNESSPPPATTASPTANIFSSTIAGDALAHMLGQVSAQPAQPPSEDGRSGENVTRVERGESPTTGASERHETPLTSAGHSAAPTGVVSMSPGGTSPGAATSAPPFGLGAAAANLTSATPEAPAVAPSSETGAGRSSTGNPPPILSIRAPLSAEAALGPGGALDTIARAIATRVTGSLSFEAEGGLRRIIVREGDLVTCASSLDSESLLAFLQSRGDFPRERAEGLANRVPAFGRHAGAALVAHGVLRQDQLWPVLRAHAEWILGRTIRLTQGLFAREAEAPGRLKGEPSVFGGSTGAEVLVEVTRRVIGADEATGRVGGPSATFTQGPNDALLVECALDERAVHIAKGALGRKLEELVAAHGSDTAPLLYALCVMGVLEVVRAIAPTSARRDAPVLDALDDEAILAKIDARLALVEEGDYFAVLGVPRTATGYEIRRAFLDLRRAFEPARLLTPKLVHLAPNVGKITTVLEEAFEILRDDIRRERYRRAIEAHPIEE
jgi:hypothetical protein